jgi:hypothetical protein
VNMMNHQHRPETDELHSLQSPSILDNPDGISKVKLAFSDKA